MILQFFSFFLKKYFFFLLFAKTDFLLENFLSKYILKLNFDCCNDDFENLIQ